MMQESTRKTISRISTVLLAFGGLIGTFALVRTWLLNRDLPAGVCPIDQNRPLLYVALILLGASLLLDILISKRKQEPTPPKVDTSNP